MTPQLFKVCKHGFRTPQLFDTKNHGVGTSQLFEALKHCACDTTAVCSIVSMVLGHHSCLQLCKHGMLTLSACFLDPRHFVGQGDGTPQRV